MLAEIRQLRRLLNRLIVPRSLFWRSLLIIVVPLLILQIILTFVFYNRHWDTVTRWLAFGVAGEVAMLAEMIENAPDATERQALIEHASRNTDLTITLVPGGRLEDAVAAADINPNVGHIDNKILESFAERLHYPFAVDLETEDPDRATVFVQIAPGLLEVVVARKRLTSTTAWLLFSWMVGGSVVLSAISIYFLRLQVRPIRQLAKAADSFGKGRDVGDFRLRGAAEIRQAAHAFNLMRHRILRHISQRTEMLAAVSHDLRTPLTRMKLELELMGTGDDPVLAGLKQDVEEMSKLVEVYLDFARGEGRESVEPTDLGPILESMRQRAERSGATLEIMLDRPIVMPLRPTAFHRCLSNLVDNACRYGRWIGISVRQKEDMVEIAVEDDGPGIPEAWREKVLEPFVRLDEKAGEGTGLGLTIARDVVLAHGGDLKLSRSRKGGLKAILRMPG
ncbi:ATP-binding protein [Benzoatithermus flavus]|uniref:histidine kinase n=1 Tax=Benzoatithermus flavus TaxID=3108223 RepID=A0ABU8XNF2_9PROT